MSNVKEKGFGFGRGGFTEVSITKAETWFFVKANYIDESLTSLQERRKRNCKYVTVNVYIWI